MSFKIIKIYPFLLIVVSKFDFLQEIKFLQIYYKINIFFIYSRLYSICETLIISFNFLYKIIFYKPLRKNNRKTVSFRLAYILFGNTLKIIYDTVIIFFIFYNKFISTNS